MFRVLFRVLDILRTITSTNSLLLHRYCTGSQHNQSPPPTDTTNKAMSQPGMRCTFYSELADLALPPKMKRNLSLRDCHRPYEEGTAKPKPKPKPTKKKKAVGRKVASPPKKKTVGGKSKGRKIASDERYYLRYLRYEGLA